MPSGRMSISHAFNSFSVAERPNPNASAWEMCGKNNRENLYYNLSEKPDAKYMFMVSIKDIKPGEELTANYNLYTYPKTGVGIQML